MELQHFSHEHPLILLNEKELKHDGYDDQKLRHCDGCLDPIFSDPSYYTCSSDGCDYFLHKLCAELPQQIEHAMHPDHPLSLLADRYCRCDVCEKRWKNFTYNCSLCDFDIDIICASLTKRNIEHTSHKHPLTPVRKPALFHCNACGTKHEGAFYQCTTCVQFWIHRDCASLPTTITHLDHHHPLNLAYSLPYEFLKFWAYCDICRKYLYSKHWAYYCAECRYFAHVNCATSKIEPFMLILSPACLWWKLSLLFWPFSGYL